MRTSAPALVDTLVANRSARSIRGPDYSEFRGGKGGIFYRAHSYHTKVPVEGLKDLIEHYTDPGDVIVDPFCGSGQTGVAAILTGRSAVLSDLSPAAVHIARGYTSKVDPDLVLTAAEKILSELEGTEKMLYGVAEGRIEYTVWSDVFDCPDCGSEIIHWDAAVDLDDGKVATTFCCPKGDGPFKKTDLRWVRSLPVQENIGVAGQRKRMVRSVEASASSRVSRDQIPYWIPDAKWSTWREMWRAQHKAMSISNASDFYTDRNLFALSSLWHKVNRLDDESLRSALRFVFTAVVNRASRRYQWHPTRPTNVLSSTMYIAALNYEFNVFSLFRRKLATIVQMYRETWDAPGFCEVRQSSATDLHWIPDCSVDYVFTDPPFGSNIFYGDSSFLWEAWLDEQTDVAAETVVNKRLTDERGRSTLSDYGDAMAQSMREIERVLRPNGWASLQFHNSDDAVWSTIQKGIDQAAMTVAAATVMDKGQKSFKGLRHESRGERVANFDLVMHLTSGDGKSNVHRKRRTVDRDDVCDELRRCVETQPPSRRSTPWLHSQVMRLLLANDADLTGWSFTAVESLCEELFEREGHSWNPRD